MDPLLILIDLEGTLSDHTDRLAILQATTKDDPRHRTAWKEYYKGLIEDEPRPHMMAWLRKWIQDGHRPVIYSTRFINKYNHEAEWLRGQGVSEHVDLVQRQPTQTKTLGPQLVAHWAGIFQPDILIDDREEVRDAVRRIVPKTVISGPDTWASSMPEALPLS